MNPIYGAGANSLFSVMAQQSAQLDSLASNMLNAGISAYQRKDYEGAASHFRKAAGLSPFSETAINAYDFMATAYLKLDRPEEAIKAYKDALRVAPNRDDLFIKLGNISYENGRYEEAEKAYQSAVRLNPFSSANAISLGQANLVRGKFGEAELQFRKAIQLRPGDRGGHYALGQAYHKSGRIEEAIGEFRKAVDLDKDFAYGYLDLGSAYADLGMREEAKAQVEVLKKKDAVLAATLEAYVYEVSKPQMLMAYGSTGFNPFQGPGALLSSMDISLATPNASKEFTMNFFFDKAMDVASVMNPFNWSLQRASGAGAGGAYNFGLPIPTTEVAPSPIPVRVYYDSQEQRAMVTFRLTQNGAGNGTIDPSHLLFRFFGKDAYGNSMDQAADEFSGFSRIV